MKRRTIIVGVIIVAAVIGVFIPGRHTDKQKTSGISQSAKDLYYCPMHPNLHFGQTRRCPNMRYDISEKGSRSSRIPRNKR